ncbi:MAG: hypothetical protein ACRC5T_08095 [Cetobacterium sp.]
MKKYIIALIAMVTFVGCSTATTIPVQKSNLTFGMVKEKLVKGETTQTQILQLFGAPNLITKNKMNDEVWSYNKMSSVGASTASSGFFTSSATRNTTTSSFDLIITFDNNDITKDYSVIANSY